MPQYIATYDLKETSPDPHEVFLEEAKNEKWSTWIKAVSGIWYKLPNTTFVKRSANIDEAYHSFRRIWAATEARGFPVTVE